VFRLFFELVFGAWLGRVLGQLVVHPLNAESILMSGVLFDQLLLGGLLLDALDGGVGWGSAATGAHGCVRGQGTRLALVSLVVLLLQTFVFETALGLLLVSCLVSILVGLIQSRVTFLIPNSNPRRTKRPTCNSLSLNLPPSSLTSSTPSSLRRLLPPSEIIIAL